ncbi:MAG: efflux RND transporter permease subunit [Longimicrobiales bacterium]
MKLFDTLLAQRRFIYLVVALLSGAGIAAAMSLPSSIYPELYFPRITIVAQGTSLGARQQMFSVTRPIEEAVSIVPGVRRVRSRTFRGASELTLDFAPQTDMIVALQLTESRVNETRGDLPQGVEIETERMLPSLFPIVTYNVMGADPGQLYDIARFRIKPALAGIPGVGRVDIQGSEIREVQVIADPARLATLGLSYDAVATAIGDALGVHAVGRMDRDYQQFLILVDNEAHDVTAVGDVVLRVSLRVRDVATVELAAEERVRLIRGNGKPAALINISRQPDGNTLELSDSVARTIETIQATLPAGVTVQRVYDQAALVREAVRSVADAMLIGAVLAVIILLLFLRDLRTTALSALAIPLTMIITVFGLKLLGRTFNLMSLGGMAIAIGLVIDDAVVVTENIARHRAFTPDSRIAIRDALAELVWPVTTSTLTTVVVFLPLVLLEGVVGQFFAALSITLSVAVLVSLVLAIVLVPLLADQFVKGHEPAESRERSASGFRASTQRAGDAIGRGLDRITEAYSRVLDSILHHTRMLAVVAVLLIVAGYFANRFVSTGFLPVMDEGAFVLDYTTPTGTALAETDRQLHKVEQILGATPEIVGTSRRTGAEMGMFATEQNSGDIVARLKPTGDRTRSIFEVIDDVRGQVELAVPRMEVEFIQILSDVINDLAGTPDPLEIKLFGDDLEVLRSYAANIGTKIESIDGIVDLYNGVPDPSPEVIVTIDQAAAGQLGLTPAEVSAQVSSALLGTTAAQVRSDEKTIDIRVRAPDSIRYDRAQLGSIPVYGADHSESTPLSAIATFSDSASAAELIREDQKQMLAVTAGVESRSLGAVIGDVQTVLAQNPPPAGVRVAIGGQYAGQQQAFHSMLLVLLLASLSVIAVMLIQFRSFIEPFVILLAAPLSFVGALALLLLTGTPLNVSSYMGMILLVGLIVKNGIILLDFAHHRMRYEAEPLGVAIRAAARVRLRPILMTTLCTLFGLLPLALGLGAGSEMQRPLALAVIGGLALSTPITLFLVPAFLVAIRGEDYRVAA